MGRRLFGDINQHNVRVLACAIEYDTLAVRRDIEILHQVSRLEIGKLTLLSCIQVHRVEVSLSYVRCRLQEDQRISTRILWKSSDKAPQRDRG
jgi:hypothetical protein